MGVRRVTLLSLTALVVVAIGAVGFGVANIAPLDVLAIIGKSVAGLPVGGDISAGSTAIVMEIRLPRILAAIAAGAALATSGAAFQSLLRNPLADPYVLGTSSGAALGAAIAFLVPITGIAWELGGVQLAAFIGALASVALVWRIAGIGSGEERIASVLLVGYAVASLLAAALSLVMLASGANLRAIFGFLLGGLAGVGQQVILLALQAGAEELQLLVVHVLRLGHRQEFVLGQVAARLGLPGVGQLGVGLDRSLHRFHRFRVSPGRRTHRPETISK